MPVDLWQAAAATVGVVGSGGLGAFLSRRTGAERAAGVERAQAETEERRESSAKLLAESYGLLIDDLREDIRDSRAHIDRQADELKAVRAELRSVRDSRDGELIALRGELAAVRGELAGARSENGRLRERVALLESRERILAPPSPAQ